MSAAQKVIDKCGGIDRTAELSGASRTWVFRWTRDADRGGTAGRIPHKAQMALLKAASEGKVDLSPADFFEVSL